MKIALVMMPWVEVQMSSLSLAGLKSFLEDQGFEVDCHYLNLLMFSRVGALATQLSFNMTWVEWLFGYHLFGPAGSGEFRETLEDILAQKSFHDRRGALNVPPERLATLIHDDIPRFLDDCLSQVPWDSYDLIGFSSIFGSHTACLKLSRELKARFPKTPIVFGGPNLDGEMGLATIKGCEWIDYVVDGEGEEALTQLARNIERGKPHERIPRVSFRRNGEVVPGSAAGAPKVDLDRLPVPNHGDFFKGLERYGVAGVTEPSLTFEASRGCWYGEKQHCTFCSFNGETMAFRAKSIEHVVRDLVTLVRKHRIGRLYATDNILGVDHLRRLLPELARVRSENKLDWEIFFEIKANLTEAQVTALAEAGVVTIQAGIESLSTPVLRLMRKGVTGIQNIQTLKLGAKHGVEVLWNILWGFPGEDPREYVRMAQTALTLTHLQHPDFIGPVRVERYSPFYFEWENFAAKKPKPHDAYRFVYPQERFRLEDIAYQFDFDGPEAVPDSSAAAAKLAEVVDFWKQVWGKNLFAYRQGLGYVTVYDSRPLKFGASAPLREETLEGLEAAVFGACETIKGVGEILSACRKAGEECGEERVQTILDLMVERKWLHQEGRHYLNLALPLSCLPPRQRLLFDQLRMVRRQMLDRRPAAQRL